MAALCPAGLSALPPAAAAEAAAADATWLPVRDAIASARESDLSAPESARESAVLSAAAALLSVLAAQADHRAASVAARFSLELLLVVQAAGAVSPAALTVSRVVASRVCLSPFPAFRSNRDRDECLPFIPLDLSL